jgi:uncharacterized membrane protein YpjA
MAVGVVAGALGFWLWYGPTFAMFPAWQWPFVPDCPLFALLFVPSLALILLKRPAPRYNAWVAFGLIKYGVWTVFVWTLYWVHSGKLTAESILMTASHVGMILEGLLLLSFGPAPSPSKGPRLLRVDWLTVTICAAWYGLSDWMDYGPFQTYPRFDTHLISFYLVQWHTVLVTVLLSGLYAYWAWKQDRQNRQVALSTVSRRHGVEEQRGEVA